MPPISPRSRPASTRQVFWLAQSASVRPARRRAPDIGGVIVTVVASVLLVLVAALGNLG